MTRSPAVLPGLAIAILLVAAPPATAQDRFGRAVAVVGHHVLVLKPGATRGPAAVYAFERAADRTWSLATRLLAGDAESGDAFGASLTTDGNMVVVASADPNVRWGGTAYWQTDEVTWAAASTRIPLAPADTTSAADAQLDLGTVMRILRPPARVVAAGNGRVAVAVGGAPAATRGVHLYARRNGRWVELAALAPAETQANDGFGTAVAFVGGRVLVGAPRRTPAGAAFVFAETSDGVWVEEPGIVPANAPERSGFGSAMAADGERVLIGAVGDGSSPGWVASYARAPSGTWAERGRAQPDTAAGGAYFGAALSVRGNELLVGAPLAGERRGTVYRFVRSGADGPWGAAGTLSAGSAEPGWVLGSSVFLAGTVAVVGAPGAHGGSGRAAVYSRTNEGWSDPEWLGADAPLDRVAGAEVRCDNGKAGQFSCDNVDLMAYLPIDALGGNSREGVSDIWGWTDPLTEKEYALVGRTGGLAVVDVSNPSSPVYLGQVSANPSGARDIKVYHDHAFMTGDGAGNHGLVVFDLTRLRDVASPPQTLEPDTVYHGIASAHNLVIDTTAGFAFPVGASGGGETCGGGLHMVDIRDPSRPTFAGCYTDTEGLLWAGRTHDAQCVVYRGPDERFRGRQICFASNETALRIVDVTDKQHPNPISAATYPGLAYVHQGWLTDDQRYFYLDDELDELVGRADMTRTVIWDVAELDDPVLVGTFAGSTPATDHNLFIVGDRMYQANYQAGLRVIDISDRAHPVEVAYFDTTPYEGNPPGFAGAWTAYPFFKSGTVIVSSMHEGLFVLRPRTALVP